MTEGQDPTPLYRIREGVYADDLLLAAVGWLDLFTWLEHHEVDEAGLWEGLGLARRPADVLCTLLRAVGLLQPGSPLRATALARKHLVAGRATDLRPYFESQRDRPTCRQLLEVLRTDRPAGWASREEDEEWGARLADPGFARSFTAAMDARAAYLGPLLAAALDDVPATRLLDIGGGSGAYAAALAERRPGLRATVLERPPVDLAARALLSDRGLGSAIEVVTGDMFAALPIGHDLHLISHVLHDWDEASVRALLARSFEALPPDGWVVDHDTHLDADKCGPLSIARYSVLLMHSTQGRCWSVAELAGMLEAVGFEVDGVRPVGGDRSALLARRPR